MTNNFRILWFEDNSDWYLVESTIIDQKLQNLYSFQTKITRELGTDYNPEELQKENKFDLILMDYQLAAGNTGEKIVNLIRKNAILTDVVLYSSEYEKMESVLKNKHPMIDGVFFADRKSELFEQKLLAVIQKIVRRSEDIVNLRGFFLDNTSDFEVRIKELLKLGWDKLPNHHHELTDAMTSVLDNTLDNKIKEVGALKKEADVYNATNNESKKYPITISGRLKVLSLIIHILLQDNLLKIPTEYDEIFHDFRENYSKKINSYRNALSHKQYSDTSIIVDGKLIPVDQKLHQKLRARITEFDKALCFLEESIASI